MPYAARLGMSMGGRSPSPVPSRLQRPRGRLWQSRATPDRGPAWSCLCFPQLQQPEAVTAHFPSPRRAGPTTTVRGISASGRGLMGKSCSFPSHSCQAAQNRSLQGLGPILAAGTSAFSLEV